MSSEEEISTQLEELKALCNAQQSMLDHTGAVLVSQYQEMYDRLDILVQNVLTGKLDKADFFDAVINDQPFQALNLASNKANREHVKVQTVYFCNYKKMRALENSLIARTIRTLRQNSNDSIDEQRERRHNIL